MIELQFLPKIKRTQKPSWEVVGMQRFSPNELPNSGVVQTRSSKNYVLFHVKYIESSCLCVGIQQVGGDLEKDSFNYRYGFKFNYKNGDAFNVVVSSLLFIVWLSPPSFIPIIKGIIALITKPMTVIWSIRVFAL